MGYIDHEIRRLFGKAINHYRLIEDGDRIAVAVSGGKDSMLLLWMLRERLRRIPINYDLAAVHVDPGFDCESADRLEAWFIREGFRYEIIRTDFGVRAHGPENRENPCFLCARLRRAALFTKARELGCGKIAFGHNQDDLIETFWINVCYGAQVAGMVPKQEFFGGEITAIRPLALVPVPTIIRMCKHLDLPIVPSNCPSADRNQRAEIRAMLDALYKKNPKVRGNIFHAMSNINFEYLPPGLPSRGKRGDGGQKTEGGRQKTEGGRQKTGDGGRKSDSGGLRPEDGDRDERPERANPGLLAKMERTS
ncbi:MAG: ATP-binding protein [Syntrophobacteraceae bacterium]